LAGQIIFGWTEATAQDQNVSPRKRGLGDAHDVLQVVTDDGLEGDFHSQAVQFFCEIKRVGVLPKRSQHLRAYGDDLSNHLGSLNEIEAKKARSEVGPEHPRPDDR